MSNCVVGSSGFGVPDGVVAEHGVERGDHLSHDGNDDDLWFLVGGGKTIMEDFESGIVSAGAHGGHVEDVTDRQTSAIDAAASFKLSAIEVIRCKSDEGGDLLAAHLSEFRQQGDEGESERGADAPHRGQQFIASREIGIGGDDLGHTSVEQKDIGLKPSQATFVEAPQQGILDVGGLVLDRDMLVAKLPPGGNDLSEPLRNRIALHGPCRHDRDIFCDQPRIEAIVLGQHATGTGELTKLVGVDPSHRQACDKQGSDDTALVAAARLDADRGGRQAMQSLDQLAPADGVVINRKALLVRQYFHVQAILRYVDSAVTSLYHLHVPSLLMRVHALATVRERKKRLERQAHSRCESRGGCGLPVVTGAVS